MDDAQLIRDFAKHLRLIPDLFDSEPEPGVFDLGGFLLESPTSTVATGEPSGKWTLSAAVVVPGVRYRRDGTGEPDDVDVVEIGAYDRLEDALRALGRAAVDDYLDNLLQDAALADFYQSGPVCGGGCNT